MLGEGDIGEGVAQSQKTENTGCASLVSLNRGGSEHSPPIMRLPVDTY